MTKVAEFKLNKINSFILNLLAIIIFIAGLQISNFTVDKLFILVKNHTFYSLSIPLIIVFAHEGIHAVAYKMFGAKLKFGVKHLSVYLTDISGSLFTLKQITVIMLLPLIFLSLILIIAAIIFTNYIALILLAILINISGSIGDILLLSYIMFKGKECRVKDENNGFSIYQANMQGSS